MADERIAVIGAGIIGLAIARQITSRHEAASVTVIDKEPEVGTHQTGHNSGVVHAGVYYPPGSLKAQLCRRGVGLLRDYCRERSLPYEECGKLIVARDKVEEGRLAEIQQRATTNGVPGLRWLRGAELQEIEPHVTGRCALHSPTTAITDFGAVARSYAGDIATDGGELWLGREVSAITAKGARAWVSCAGEQFEFDRVIVCAGLQSDRLARSAGDAAAPMIVPFRGEYLRLVPARESLVRGLIYPVPDPRYPFLGVHFTRRVGGGVNVGPNAVLALAREGYRWRDVSVGDLREMLGFAGFRRMAVRHWRTGARETAASLLKPLYVAEARSFLPDLRARDLVPAPAGVRAQAVDGGGRLVDDFRISRLGAVTAVRNAPSPGATSSLAIAEYVIRALG